MRLASLLLPFVCALGFAGCAARSAAPVVIPTASVSDSVASTPEDPSLSTSEEKTPDPTATSPSPTEAELEGEESGNLPHATELRDAISAWIAANPEADFDETAREANRFLRRLGYPLVLNAARLVKPGQAYLRLKAGGRWFTFDSGRELSRNPEVCGERLLSIPGRITGREEAVLVVRGREYPFSLKGLQREAFRIRRKGKLVATLFSPEPTEPIGLVATGKAFLLRFPLDEESTLAWWQRMGLQQPSLLDEEPYLVLRVNRSSVFFDENIEHLPAQEFEVEEGKGAHYRWKFLPSGLVLELNSTCAHAGKRAR